MRVRKALRKWGNGYGILISKSEAASMGLREGDQVEADVVAARTMRVQDLPSFPAGNTRPLDDILDEDLVEEHRARQARARGAPRP